MPAEDKDILNNIINGYASDIQQLEDENRILKETVAHLKREISKFQQPPLLVAEVKEVMGEHALLKLNNGNEFFVMVGPEADDISAGDTVLVEQKNLTIIRKIQQTKTFSVDKFVIIEKPTISWKDIGGLDEEINEIREVVELPLTKPELFEKVGIQPPKGVLLHGPPGTGKTTLAKAVAAATNSTFIEVVGSELVQKFIGEGAKLIKDIFQLARENAPAIIFIDEIDALAAKRIEIGTSGEREVQRTFMQFLAEVDGFKNLGNVKIIGCTNRKDILDPAVMRPGRLDRLIYVGEPDIEGIKQIFKIHTKKMKIDKRFNIDSFAKRLEGFSGAEIKAVCTEAGYFAIRANRTRVTKKDFESAVEKVRREEARDSDYLKMFG
ncbi:AAA family ATPase [Candidatus Woesearchaeota archaeon]|nr:MAG: AAA family ATPase [Candidatus Woesearchaeota archaeon]